MQQANSIDSTQTYSRTRIWLMAARPKTLPAAVGSVLVGSALAYSDGAFLLWPALAAVAVALLLQVGSNLANDYFDHQKGSDTAERLGPLRVTSGGLVQPGEMIAAMIVVFGAAALVGAYLIFVGGWPLLAVGAAAIVAALAYTGGPLPFGYYGLGDLFVFVFFGLVAVGGTYYVQALTLPAHVIAAAVPVGALVTAILVVNNLRDIDSDRSAGKRTLAVMLGKRGTRIEYVGLLAVAYAAPMLSTWIGWSPWVLLSWLTLPQALRLIQAVMGKAEGRGLNATLAGTARLSLAYSLFFAAGILL